MTVIKTCTSVIGDCYQCNTSCVTPSRIEKDSVVTSLDTAIILKLHATTLQETEPVINYSNNDNGQKDRIRGHALIAQNGKDCDAVNSVVSKKRRLSSNESVEVESSRNIAAAAVLNSKRTPYIPEPLLGTLLAPFLDDRETFNNFKLSSREVYTSCRNIPAPWPRQQVQCNGVVQAVIFSPSGELLAFSSDSALTLLDRQTGNRRTLYAPSKITSLAFAPGGRYLASGQHPMENQPLHDRNIAVCLWDLHDLLKDNGITSGTSNHSWCQVLYRYGGAHSVAFSHTGELLASGGMGMMVHLWKREMYHVPDKQQWQHHHFTYERSQSGMSNWIYQVKFSPDGKYLAAVGEGEQAFWLWDIQNDFAATLFNDLDNAHQETVHCIDFTPDGKFLISGSDDETIRVWDLSPTNHKNEQDATWTPRCCRIMEGNQCSVWALACAPASKDVSKRGGDDETLIVSGSKDKDSGDGRVLRLWSLETGKTVRILRGHCGYITSIAFSPSGNTIASGSFDERVMTHRVESETTELQRRRSGAQC
jgi:WD40 repeat protein